MRSQYTNLNILANLDAVSIIFFITQIKKWFSYKIIVPTIIWDNVDQKR